MDKTVDLSVSTRTKQYLAAGGAAWLFVVPVSVSVLFHAGVALIPAFAASIAGASVVVVVWVRRLGGGDDDATWAAIPNWQYDGRFAEAGGLTRSEQEAALDDLSDEE